MFCQLSNWDNCEIEDKYLLPRHIRIVLTFCAFACQCLGATAAFSADRTVAIDPAIDPAMATQLSQEFRGSFRGKPVRQACQSIAASAGVNLWFDPAANPSRAVDINPADATVYRAIVDAADAADLAVAIAPTFLIVSVPGRVDRLLAAAHAKHGNQTKHDGQTKHRDRTKQGERIDANLEMLTTPPAAMIKMGLDPAAAENLPHDLWPKYDFRGIDPVSFISVVQTAYQDGLKFADPPAITEVARLAYPAGVARRIDQIEPIARSRRRSLRRDQTSAPAAVELAGTWSQQRQWLSIWISTLPRPTAKSAASSNASTNAATNTATFSLKVRARAVDVIDQLAAAANRRVVWPADLQSAKDQLIELDAKDETLEQLIDRIASQIGATAQWTETTIQILPSAE